MKIESFVDSKVIDFIFKTEILNSFRFFPFQISCTKVPEIYFNKDIDSIYYSDFLNKPRILIIDGIRKPALVSLKEEKINNTYDLMGEICKIYKTFYTIEEREYKYNNKPAFNFYKSIYDLYLCGFYYHECGIITLDLTT